MRILITGGCGFLGSHLVEHFHKNTEAEIVVLDRLSYASSGFDRLRDINAFNDPRVHVLGCDLSLPIPEGVAHEIGQVDYIIHAAAETHVDNSIADPLPFIQSNVLGTHHLLWFARQQKALRRVLIVSTDEVYGPAQFGDHVVGFDEDASYRPANPYAAAKCGGEAIGMAYANTYKLPITIVNTMNLIGERQNIEKMVPRSIRNVLLGEKMTIHADETRTKPGTRFYLHCRTYANALAWLIDRNDRAHRSGPAYVAEMPLKVHVCGEREISNLELAQTIAKLVGKPLLFDLVDFHSSRPGHDLRYHMRDGLIREMGWKRPMNLEQSLEKTVQWYLANPKWLGL